MRFASRLTLRITCLAIVLALTGANAWAASIELVQSDPLRVVFEIRVDDYSLVPSRYVEGAQRLEIPGLGSFSLAGHPAIPGRDYLVALPPDGRPTVTFSVLATEALGQHRMEPVPYPMVFRDDNDFLSSSAEYRIDAEAYDSGGTSIGVTAQAENRLRHHRVLPVRVQPVSYDPQSGETILATRIRVEIALSGGRRPTPAAPVIETDIWERIYSRVLVNAESARLWRTSAVRPADPSGVARRAIEATAGPLVKLAVRESAMHRVTASSVIAKGFPTGVQTSDLRLFQRYYDDVLMTAAALDLPYRVIEDGAGTSGEFDGNDVVLFYGQRLREDTLRNDSVEKFAEDNIYWIGSTTGTQMPTKVVTAGTVTADTATASFPVTVHVEVDRFFVERTPPVNNLTGQPTREFYFYNSDTETSFSAPFTLGPVMPGTTFDVRALFLGGWKIINDRNVQIDLINASGTTRLADVVVPITRYASYSESSLPSSLLATGANQIRLLPVGSKSTLEACMDWAAVDYRAPYRATGNQLVFNTGSLTGSETLTVTGLSRTDVRLFEITDPLGTVECQLDASHFTDLGGGQYALSFQTNITSQQKYFLAPVDAVNEIQGDAVIEDESSNMIKGPAENGVDILVVSHKDYVDEIQRWVDYRKAQGYRILLADVDDVFDEFNGGVNNARAIRDLVRHFFANGGASCLLLVGDASEDNKRVHVESKPNFVPTESFPEHVASPVFNEDEIVTSDKWYGMLGADVIYEPAPFPADYYPDVIVGRFPAGTVDELRIIIDKTIQFEQPTASDFWRRRMLRVADDAWSGIGSTCLQPPEGDFEVAEESAAFITEQSMRGANPGGPSAYDVVRFYLSDRISHPAGGCTSAFAQIQAARAEATPDLLGELSQGATIVSMQAHMNRFQVCHEFLFTSSGFISFPPDYLNFSNDGRPFILFGMGCHMSDYALHRESTRSVNGPNGDALSELLLVLDNKGAVNTYGSTGFEYLRENKNYTSILAEVFFTDPPSGATLPSNNNQVRWIMGELMATAEIDNLLRFPLGSGLGSRGQAKRYHTLGDPLLRIDAGPPRFDVTVNGQDFQSGETLFPAADDSVRVQAVITDEVAIERLTLEIDGVDASSDLTITPLMDLGLDKARQYDVSFSTQIEPRPYDIVLKAHQAADATSGTYHMVAEFVFKVEFDISFSINGRPVIDGDLVDADGDYLFELDSPVVIDPALIRVEIDGNGVTPLNLTYPDPQDSTMVLIGFTSSLAPGAHDIQLFADLANFEYNVSVGSQVGLRDLIAYPNPFQDEMYFVYSNDMAISNGSIDIFTTSGKKVAHLEIPASARAAGQNTVRWDGTTWSGGGVANGAYLFVVRINQGGQTTTERGKLVRVR